MKELEIQFDGEAVYVMDEDKKVFLWNDDWTHECPEDLTWGRNVSELFVTAFNLGVKYANRSWQALKVNQTDKAERGNQ